VFTHILDAIQLIHMRANIITRVTSPAFMLIIIKHQILDNEFDTMKKVFEKTNKVLEARLFDLETVYYSKFCETTLKQLSEEVENIFHKSYF
jgi:hypothetical protein